MCYSFVNSLMTKNRVFNERTHRQNNLIVVDSENNRNSNIYKK